MAVGLCLPALLIVHFPLIFELVFDWASLFDWGRHADNLLVIWRLAS